MASWGTGASAQSVDGDLSVLSTGDWLWSEHCWLGRGSVEVPGALMARGLVCVGGVALSVLVVRGPHRGRQLATAASSGL